MVLGGFLVIRTTLGGVGRAPAFEAASAIFVTVIGIWLLVRALRHEYPPSGGRALAVAAGLVPCPLTTFIMVYASANGIVMAGLLVTAAMALGMIGTLALLVLCTIVLRERAVEFFDRTAFARERLVRALEISSACLIIAFGVWLLATTDGVTSYLGK